VESPAESLSRARRAAERAIAIDHDLAEAHSALGFVQFRIDWDWAAAEVSLKRACELNPGLAGARHRYALLLSVLGRHDEALAEITRAEELDPLSLIIGTAHGRLLHFAHRYGDAVERLRHTLEIDPAFQQAHFDLGMSYAELGRWSESVAEIEPFLQAGDRRTVMLAVFGNICARSGQEARARTILAELRERSATGATTVMALGYVLVGLGELDDAVTCFERAAEERAGLIVFLKVEPMVDPLRGHARFVRLLQRLRLD
jgi:tetratricopeptide (TPR) repeat protein